MNHKKAFRKGFGLLSLAALLAGLTGCSAADAKEGAGNTGGKTKLTFAFWDQGQRPGMQQIADLYTAQNPHIEIDLQVTGWNEYWTKLEAGVSSGKAPDVFWMHSAQILDYADAGMLADCTDIVNVDDFTPSAVAVSKGSDGRIYGMPKDKDTVALVYNKEIFDAAGVAYPDETWTWNTLVEASETIYENTGKYGYMAYADDQLGYWPFVYQAGGYIINDDKTAPGYTDEKTQEAMEFYMDLQKTEWCPDQNFFAQTQPGDAFFSGTCAMYIEGAWNMLPKSIDNPEMNGKWDVAVLPAYPTPENGDGRATISNSLTYATAEHGRNKEEALKFIEFLGTREAQEIQGVTGTAIPAYKGLESTWVNYFAEQGYKQNVQPFIDQFEYGVPYPIDKSRPSWMTSVNATVMQMYAGTLERKTGFERMQSLVLSAMEGY